MVELWSLDMTNVVSGPRVTSSVDLCDTVSTGTNFFTECRSDSLGYQVFFIFVFVHAIDMLAEVIDPLPGLGLP